MVPPLFFESILDTKTLKRLKYDNVHVKVGDGFKGWPSQAPFDKIIFDAFQTLIEDHAPANLSAAKHAAWQFLDSDASAAPDAVPITRHARTAFRVALRQWEHLYGANSASAAWRQLCDPTHHPAEVDIRPPHDSDN